MPYIAPLSSFWSIIITTSPCRRFGALVAALTALVTFGTPSALAARPQYAITVANVQVSHDAAQAHSEPAIAENPKNPKNLVAGSKFFSDPAHYLFKIGTYYTRDGGRTWHDNGVLPGFDGFSLTSDISFAFAANGTAYACVLGIKPDGTSGVYVSSSMDGGKTWSLPSTVFFDPTNNTFSDKSWIAVDTSHGKHRGTIYVAWNLDGNTDANAFDPDALFTDRLDAGPVALDNALVVSHSSDGGLTWSSPVSIFDFDQAHFALGAIPAVGPDGVLRIPFLTWIPSGTKTINQLAMVSSTDGGETFSAPRVAVSSVVGLPNHLPNTSFRNLSLPAFAISPQDNSMVLTWADMRNGDADILAVSSFNAGKTWTKPVRVNHDHLGNGKDQFQPAIAVSPNGVYTCSWFDRRHDPNNILIDVDLAQSTDDGRNFGTNFRVTKKSWDPSVDAPIPSDDPKSTFIGDYQALAVDNTAVHPLWNDTQNRTSQEIRSAVISTRTLAAAERRP